MIWIRRVLAAMLAVVWVSALVHAEDKEEREGGIIGTGIVGTISHLGSVYVNGQRIETDGQMPVAGSVPSMTAADLRPGHTVAITIGHRNSGWHADHIRQVLPVVGPVTALSDGKLTVLATQVDPGGDVTGVKVGDWVAVSGLWQGNIVRASLIEKLAAADHQAQLSGTYLSHDPNGNLVIGDSVVSGIAPQHLQAGDLVRVLGQPTPNGISASRFETGLFQGAIGIVQVQGYYSVPQPSGLYTVLGSGLVAYSDRPEMIDPNDRVIRCGESGRLVGGGDPGAVQSGPNADLLIELGC